MYRKLFGWICVLWSILFAHIETKYFGVNLYPKTKEELFCDITCALLGVCGIIILKTTNPPHGTNY